MVPPRNIPAPWSARLTVILAAVGSTATAQGEPSPGGALERSFAPLARDESLSRAAARHLASLGSGRAPARLASVRAALRAEGLADAQVLPFAAFAAQAPKLEVEALQFLDARVVERGYTHYGLALGTSAGRTGLVVFFVRRLVELPPLPSARAPRALRGLLLSEVSAVEGYFTLTSGEVARAEAKRRGRDVRIELPEDEAVESLELIVHTERGPEVAAWVSYGPSARPRPAPLRDEAELLAALRDLRAGFGRPPLETSATLARAAAGHAEWVCQSRLAVHRRPDGESPIDRARRAGHRGAVLENLAIAPTLEEAHQNLLDSPSHRANLLAEEASVIGVGLAERTLSSGRMLCLVQLLGAPLPSPSAAR